MNVDTKIATKALALRMREVIPIIINYDQTTYVEGRFIRESIRLINDILYHAEHENLDGILFAGDMEKAFDSLEHSFIFATLTRFGFGKDFIQWIRTLLCHGSSCVMNKMASQQATLIWNVGQGRAIHYPLTSLFCV